MPEQSGNSFNTHINEHDGFDTENETGAYVLDVNCSDAGSAQPEFCFPII